jgi:hypothetical protein
MGKEVFQTCMLLKKAHLMRPEHFCRGENFRFTLSNGSVLHRVWEGRVRERDLALRMLSSSFPLLASLAHFKRLDASL